MRAPVVSVLITTFNYGRFIGEAIESVLSQDFPLDRLEILVIDDGSTDDTEERVKKYSSHIRFSGCARRGRDVSGIIKKCPRARELVSLQKLQPWSYWTKRWVELGRAGIG